MNMHLEWGFFLRDIGDGKTSYLDWMISAWGWTLAVAACAWVVALVMGSIIGTLRTLPSEGIARWLVKLGNAWVELFRNIPLLVQIFLWYHVIPSLYKPLQEVPSFALVVVGLGLFTSARVAEQVRAGIQSVSRGQVNAGYALGLTYGQSMRLIVLPQAFRNMLPVLFTQTIILFQDTSLVYAIGAYDMLKGFEVAGKNFNRPVEAYLLAAVVYFIICFSLSTVVKRLQAKIAIIR